MQLYSLIVTSTQQGKEQLAPWHFNQPMIKQAPVVITFCADVRRFSMWCEQRGAEPGYDNFAWFVNGLIDTVLVSQNVALEAESEGLGICYLGTTTYNAAEISQVLQLPGGVIPVTTLVVGYPQEPIPSLTDRLPLEAVIHREHYQDYTSQIINDLWREKEQSPETQEFLRQNELPNLARIFTEKRYKTADNLHFSRKYFDALQAQGFFNQ